VDSITNNLLQAETDKRGYQLTSDVDYLKNYYKTKNACNNNIINLRENNAGGDDLEIISQIDSLLVLRMANLDSGIVVFTTKGFDEAVSYMQLKTKRSTRNLLNLFIVSYKNSLSKKLGQDTHNINSRSSNNLKGLIVLGTFFVLLMFFAARTFRRAQQKIIKNHIKFKEAQRIAKIGSWEWDLATNKLTWSQEQFRLFGEDRKTFDRTFESYLNHLSEKEQENTKALIKEALEGKANYAVEHEILLKDGTMLMVFEQGTVLYDEANKPIGMFGTTQDITDRKKAEASLYKSEERYRQIVETAQEGIWMLDENNYTIFVNRKMCEMLEYSREEMMGRQNYYFKDDEGKKKAMQDIERRKQGITETQISKFITKSGKTVWTSVSTNPIIGDKGNYVGALGMFTDITARKKADEELVVAQQKYQTIFDNTADGIYQSTVDGKFIMANPSMARIFGYDSPDDLMSCVTNIGTQIYADPDQRKKMSELILAQGHVENYELQVLTKTKDTIWVSANIRIVRDETGGIDYFEGTLEDITNRKKSEEQLLNMSNRLQLAIHATSIGIWDWDIANNNTVWDDEMYQMYNVDHNDPRTITEAWEAAIHPDDFETVKENLEMALRGEEEYDTEFRIIWKDKTVHHVKGNALVQRDRSGNAIRMIGTNTDITQRKEAEEEILQLNKNLDQFANITAHDLQEPIRMVSGFLGLLDKKYSAGIDEQGKTYIYRAKDGADRMSILIKDLLEFSRSGNKGAKKEPVDLGVVMDLVNKDLSIVVADTGSILHIPPCLPTVVGTQSALYRLFLNLISNGIKFRKKETAPEVTLTVNELPDSWEFTLQDNGIGIAEKDQPKLFQAFQRLHRREDYPGTGLGLVTCKKIVETHGGKIWITSEYGKGTAFHFTIKKPE
jgi:PAS domain S-box-containing protein